MNSPEVKFLRSILIIGILLMILKFIAWEITNSNTLLTDALESIVNILAGSFTLYSIYFATKPMDKDHPYGHGKIEFIASGIEGSLIGLAGILMIYKSVSEFDNPNTVLQLDFGILLATFSGAINYMMGFALVKKGNSVRSLAMVASGEHLKSDGYTSAGMIIGLVFIYFTNYFWVDNVIATLLGFILIYTCISIIRKSIGGIMDEADMEIVNEVVQIFKSNRSDKWIDIHNLRVIKYGNSLHIDCHVTLPWYLNLQEAHDEMDKIQKVVEQNLKTSVEFFIHNDPCLPTSCAICKIHDCKVRKEDFKREIEWNTENLITNRKHQIK